MVTTFNPSTTGFYGVFDYAPYLKQPIVIGHVFKVQILIPFRH